MTKEASIINVRKRNIKRRTQDGKIKKEAFH